MDRWEKETGDTIPAAEKMTADRHDKDDWSEVYMGQDLIRGAFPGQITQAHLIKNAGSILDN